MDNVSSIQGPDTFSDATPKDAMSLDSFKMGHHLVLLLSFLDLFDHRMMRYVLRQEKVRETVDYDTAPMHILVSRHI